MDESRGFVVTLVSARCLLALLQCCCSGAVCWCPSRARDSAVQGTEGERRRSAAWLRACSRPPWQGGFQEPAGSLAAARPALQLTGTVAVHPSRMPDFGGLPSAVSASRRFPVSWSASGDRLITQVPDPEMANPAEILLGSPTFIYSIIQIAPFLGVQGLAPPLARLHTATWQRGPSARPPPSSTLNFQGCDSHRKRGKREQRWRHLSLRQITPRSRSHRYEAWWQSGLMRKTRNLVPSGASVRIRPTSKTNHFFCFSFFFLSSSLPLRGQYGRSGYCWISHGLFDVTILPIGINRT